jgi:pyruvate/2-oxoacid:ferredoxin oxidoreductase beta subunit
MQARQQAGRQMLVRQQTTKKGYADNSCRHGRPYVATATIAFPADLNQKVDKAIITPVLLIQVHAPAVPGGDLKRTDDCNRKACHRDRPLGQLRDG